LIVIVLGDISGRDVDPDLRLYLKTNVVLHWGDKLFWQKLRYALPDPAQSKQSRPAVSKATSPSLVSSSCSSSSSLGAIISNNNSQMSQHNSHLIQQHQQHQKLSQQQQPRYTSRLSPASMSSTLSASPLPSTGNLWLNNNVGQMIRQNSPRALPISPVPSSHIYGESTYSQPDYYQQTAVHI
jgi:hypothetical protein